MKSVSRVPEIKQREEVTQKSSLFLRSRAQMALSFFSLAFLSMLVLAAVFYWQATVIAEKGFRTMAIQDVTKTGSALELYLNSIIEDARSITNDRALSACFSSEGDEKLSPSCIIETLASLPVQRYLYNDNLLNIFVLYEGQTYTAYSRNNRNPSSVPVIESPYRRFSGAREGIKLLGTELRFYSQGEYENVVSVAGIFREQDEEGSLVVCIVDFSYEGFAELVMPPASESHPGSRTVIADSQGNIMFDQDPGLLTTPLKADFMSKIGKGEKYGFISSQWNGQPVYAAYNSLPGFGWKVISITPRNSVLDNLSGTRAIVIGFCSAFTILVLVFSLVASSSFLKPLNELTAILSEYEQSQFLSNKLHRAGNRSPAQEKENMSRLGSIVEKLYSIQLSQKEAQIKSLQNQINPHFLYNTLESIRGAALFHGIHDIAAMAKCLSLFFRYSISEENLVKIREELQHLENYIAIQNFRHDNKFLLVYNIAERLYNYKILKLTLQPLVENSIKHGLEMKLGKGTIKVEILDLGSVLKIVVHDDGIGMSPEKVRELNRMLESGSPHPLGDERDREGVRSGIGVWNVNSRIRLYFGEQYGLRYRESSVGTTAEVTLPIVE